MVIDGSGSAENNVLLNLMKYELPSINKTYLSVNYYFKSKYLLLINGQIRVEIKT